MVRFGSLKATWMWHMYTNSKADHAWNVLMAMVRWLLATTSTYTDKCLAQQLLILMFQSVARGIPCLTSVYNACAD